MFRHCHMHDATPLVREHDEDKQQPGGGRRHDEEIRGHDLVDMLARNVR
jgi:hypothetical protein